MRMRERIRSARECVCERERKRKREKESTYESGENKKCASLFFDSVTCL